MLNEEGLAIIEANADTVLEEIGIEFRDDAEALALWKDAGADIKGERVHFPKGFRARSSNRAKRFHAACAQSGALGADRRQCDRFRTGLRPAFCRAISKAIGAMRRLRISQLREARLYGAVHPSLGRYRLRTGRRPGEQAHLDMVLAHMTLSDKPFMGSVTAPERAEDTVAMAKILFGDDFVDANTVVINLINPIRPWCFDETMLGAAKVYARNNQATIITPFILAGAMSPVTVAGTLTQILAEVLAGAAFTQLIRAGAPVLFGTFASSISMQSGAPTFGTPERRSFPTVRPAGPSRGSAIPDRRIALRLQGA